MAIPGAAGPSNCASMKSNVCSGDICENSGATLFYTSITPLYGRRQKCCLQSCDSKISEFVPRPCKHRNRILTAQRSVDIILTESKNVKFEIENIKYILVRCHYRQPSLRTAVVLSEPYLLCIITSHNAACYSATPERILLTGVWSTSPQLWMRKNAEPAEETKIK